MRNILLGLTLALLAVHASGSKAGAQAAVSEGSARVPATIALTDRLPPGSRFVVKRSPLAARRDIILLATDANEQDLSAAIRALLAVRQREGDVPANAKTLRLRPTGSNPHARPALPWVGRVLADVKRADRIEIREVGTVRAVQIWLPRQGKSRSRSDRSG
jgi:hypothetical protein